MNIAFFPSSFHPHAGGVEEVCRHLASALAGQGHEVGVWTERWPRTLPALERYEGIDVHRFAMRVPADSWKAKLSYLLMHLPTRARVRRSVQQSKIGLLHAHCVSSTSWYALHVRKALGLPLVVTLHGELTMDADGVFQKPGIGQRIMRRTLREADAITACSKRTLREAEAFHGRSFGARARVIYNGIDLRGFAAEKPYAHPRPYILAIGRHVREKGFDLLLRAYALASDLGCDLILAGDGRENASLKALAGELSLGGKVHFPGRVDHDAAIGLFKGCEFFVLPSRQEPFGLVNLEAMAAGKAIVATEVGGVPEFVTHGLNALLVPPENPEALSEAMRTLARQPDLRARFGEMGSEQAQRFKLETIAKDYDAIYQSLSEDDRQRVRGGDGRHLHSPGASETRRWRRS